MGLCHIQKGNGPPTSVPTFSGQHYQDEQNGLSYISVNTAGVFSWKAAGGDAVQTNLSTHETDFNNPHQITPAQIGLGNVLSDIASINSDQGIQNTSIASINSEQNVQNTGIAANLAANMFNANNISNNTSQIQDNEQDIEGLIDDVEDLEASQITQTNDISANTTLTNNHIADTNNPHQTTLLNLQDVLSTAYTGANKHYTLRSNAAGSGVELFEQYEVTASRVTPLLHQATTFANYLPLNAVIPVTGKYILFMTHRFSFNATNVNFLSHVEYNGNFFMTNHFETKDAFGNDGILVDNTTGGQTLTGTDNFQTLSSFKTFESLPVGPAVFNLEFRGETANHEATIYEAEMFLKRVSE